MLEILAHTSGGFLRLSAMLYERKLLDVLVNFPYKNSKEGK
jgi:hypothetical protein